MNTDFANTFKFWTGFASIACLKIYYFKGTVNILNHYFFPKITSLLTYKDSLTFFPIFLSFDYLIYLTYKCIEHLQYIQDTYFFLFFFTRYLFFKLYFSWLFCVWHGNIQHWKIQPLYSIFSQLKKIQTSKSTIQHSAIKDMKKGCPGVFDCEEQERLSFLGYGRMKNWYYILAWS